MWESKVTLFSLCDFSFLFESNLFSVSHCEDIQNVMRAKVTLNINCYILGLQVDKDRSIQKMNVLKHNSCQQNGAQF